MHLGLQAMCHGDGPHELSKPLRGMKLLGLKGNSKDGLPTIEMIATLWNYRTTDKGNSNFNLFKLKGLVFSPLFCLNCRIFCGRRHKC